MSKLSSKTFDATTQYVSTPMSTHLIIHVFSPFPALDISRCQEYVATDTIYADSPAIDCGHTIAQFYCGMDSHICDVYRIKPDKQFINSFEDIIELIGAIDRFIIDQS